LTTSERVVTSVIRAGSAWQSPDPDRGIIVSPDIRQWRFLPAESSGGNHMVDIILWIVLGAIAGWVAGLLVRGDEGLGVIGHIVLGIVGALVGGFLADNVLGLGVGAGAKSGDVNITSIIVAVVGAVIVVLVVGFFTGNRRAGRGPI
jgi:uncharacterized membrane protein YeaQ/YmgE (transglycosylase-associated protein family)